MNLNALIARLPGTYGVYAKNLHTGKTLAFNERAVVPAASLIKVPILAELYRRVEEEGLVLDETVAMHKEDQVPGSGVLKDLTPNTAYSLRDLAALMITVSDNTAANLLIDYLGVESVNALLRRLGLLHTALERRMERIPMERPRLNRTTAYDMTRLMEMLTRGEVISAEVSRRMVGLLELCQAPCSLAPNLFDPPFVGALPRPRVAHKTGSLNDARHDSGIVYGPDAVLAVTILSHGAPEAELKRSIDRVGRALYHELRR